MLTIQENISLKSYNTFQVDAKARFFVEIEKEEDIQSLVKNEVWATYPHLILGGGANMLFTKDYEWIIVKVALKGKEILSDNEDTVLIKCWAGEDWHETMMWILEQGYVWVENLVFIPWLVGAAPVGNIGAYGKEAKDIISEVEGIDLTTWTKKMLSNEDCQFAYRDSIFKRDFKGRFLVTSVTFHLQKDSPDYKPDTQYKDLQAAIEKKWWEQVSGLEVAYLIIELRKNKLPDRHSIGTAGSFFKNPIITQEHYDELIKEYPTLIGREVKKELRHLTLNTLPTGRQVKHSTLVKLSAGQLIDLAGMKWYQQGHVSISAQHALVLLNDGEGTGADIVQLAEYIQDKVSQQFGVRLDPEVLYV